jgi:5-methylcytosine-specific restriction protein A
VTREVPEWIGATDDAAIPPRVRLRVFDRMGGICHLSGRKINAGDAWDLDHIVALVNGGAHRESNMAPALRSEHRKKTAEDVKQKAKNDRVRKRHLGIKKPSKFACSRDSKFKKKIDGSVVLR